MTTTVRAESLSKSYRSGDLDVPALRDLDFTIGASEFVCFVGPSGSGKSTLLNLIGCLDHPTSGTLRVLDTNTGELNSSEAADFRGANIGFVFQDFNLIPVLTAFENVEYPLVMVQRRPAPERKSRVTALLEAVGMAEHAHKRPDQLSGGQKQRIAVARALVSAPKLVLADEPTANLDHETAHRILDLMKQMRDASGTTFIFSTHDPKIMQLAEHTLVLEDGRLTSTSTGRRS